MDKKLTVKVVGVIGEDTYILGTPSSYVTHYEDVRDCFFTYSSKFNVKPYVFFLQDDLRGAENEVLGAPCISTMVMGNQFISFNEDMSDEDIENTGFAAGLITVCDICYYDGGIWYSYI